MTSTHFVIKLKLVFKIFSRICSFVMPTVRCFKCDASGRRVLLSKIVGDNHRRDLAALKESILARIRSKVSDVGELSRDQSP